ncbi:hypothetical protein WA158_006669 [Blastocystis sp. Blastoise]
MVEQVSQEVLELINTDYKKAKEIFALNTAQPSLAEALLVIYIAIPFYFLYQLVFDLFIKLNIPLCGSDWKSVTNLFLLDFSMIICVNIAAETCMESHYWILGACVILCLLIGEYLRRHPISQTQREMAGQSPYFQPISLNDKQKSYFTMFRGITMGLTVLAICAVDFPIFPRRLAKTLNWGCSLMDMGVGIFVINSGMVSRQLRYKGGMKAVKAALSSVSPLLILGFLRLFFVYEFGYQHVVTEYGVHWNFFFTLGLVAIFSAICATFLRNRLIVWISIITILSSYQYWLLHGGTEYLLNDNRTTLFDMNKEGILSCFGYFSIYLAGLLLGNEFNKERTRPEWKLAFWVSDHIQVSSRRMGNAAYVLLTVACGGTYAGLALLVNILVENLYIPIFYQAINYNQLFIFLLANVCTGLINYLFKTIIVPTWQAYLILICYMVFITLVAYIMYYKKIKVKFW